MAIRMILVPVRGDGKGEGVLDHALVLARRFNAHLNVVHSHAKPEDMVPFGTLGVTEDMRKQIVEAATAAAESEEARVKTLLTDYLKDQGVPIIEAATDTAEAVTASWIEETGEQAANVAVLGRLADLIIVAKPDSEDGLGSRTLQAALLEGGKPVMMVPPAPAKTIGAHVALGWNGANESAKAVSATLTLMKAADRVSVFSAPVSTEPRLAVDKLVDYLRRHEITAEAEIIDVKASEVGAALLGGAKKAGADVLVMGAYGHSRARQLVMGGVTSHVIENADMPVILVD